MLSAVCAEKEWFLFVPYAIPARVVCPFFKMHVNGIPLEDGSPLLSVGYVLPAVIVSLMFALAVSWGSSKLFSRGGWAHE
jgi:ABC-2 type transport system permease protein